MAGPNLPTNRTTASTIAEHVADHNAAHNVVNKFDKDATSTTGDSLVWNGTVYVPSPRVLINVADYATPQLALDAAPAGAHIVFQSSYALSAALVVKADNQWIDARGASFTMSTWATPVFDAINRNGCTFDVGTVTYTGTRGAVGTAIRGENGYTFGCAVWINGDRNNVRSGRIIGMPGGAACFSPWNGTTLYGQQHVGNRLGVGGDIEVSGYNFGTLILWQKDFVIGNLYGHDDIDDSSGTNPTHVYYVQGDSTHRSSGLSVINARVVNNIFGQPFQMKYADGVSIGSHSADSSKGLANFLDCNDLTIDTMLGTNCLANGGTGALTLDFTTAPCKRLRAGVISIQLAANVDERAASIWADDAEVTNLSVEANHSAAVNVNIHLVVLRGDRGRIKSSTLRSVGAGHMRGFTAGFGATVVNDWTLEDLIVRGSRAVLDVVGGSSRVKVRYDPSVQTYTGTATPVSVTGTPVGGELLIEIPTNDQQQFMSSLGSDPTVAVLSSATSLTFAAANNVTLMRFVPYRSVVVSSLRWVAHSVSSGNYDIGIYTSGGTRLWAKGSTAWPAANAVAVETVSPTVALSAGVEYLLALGSDATTGTFRGATEPVSNLAIMLDGTAQWARTVASSFPLPSTITPGNSRSGRLPLIIVHGT